MSSKFENTPENNEFKIRKIPPYPILLELNRIDLQGQPAIRGHIVKLTEHGFLMRVESSIFKVGDMYQLVFILPVLEHTISVQGKVIKTYDAIESIVGKELKKLYTVEVHFKDLQTSDKAKIKNYLVRSGQVAR